MGWGGICCKKAEVQFHMKTELHNSKEKATGCEKRGTEMKTSCSMNSYFIVLQNALNCTNWHIIKTGKTIKLPTFEVYMSKFSNYGHRIYSNKQNVKQLISTYFPCSEYKRKGNISKNCGWILCW